MGTLCTRTFAGGHLQEDLLTMTLHEDLLHEGHLHEDLFHNAFA